MTIFNLYSVIRLGAHSSASSWNATNANDWLCYAS